MKLTDKRHVLKRMEAVRAVVRDEIKDNSNRGGIYASGLANEGFAGGYLQALDDIDAALRHGYPSDHRRYWSEAERRDHMRSATGNPIPVCQACEDDKCEKCGSFMNGERAQVGNEIWCHPCADAPLTSAYRKGET